METVVASPMTGKIKKIEVVVKDDVKAGDLLVEIEP